MLGMRWPSDLGDHSEHPVCARDGGSAEVDYGLLRGFGVGLLLLMMKIRVMKAWCGMRLIGLGNWVRNDGGGACKTDFGWRCWTTVMYSPRENKPGRK